MSESSHTTTSNSTTTKTPKSLFVLIVVILAAMYYYAAFVDTNKAEATVDKFYLAYFDRDFDTVSSQMSVFWSAQFLPQYQNLEPNQVLEDRAKIEQEIKGVLTSIESNQAMPPNLSIQILSEYTRELSYSALVAYNFIQDGTPVGMEMALLIKEGPVYKIFNLNPINDEILSSVTDEEMEIINNNFKSLLGIDPEHS